MGTHEDVGVVDNGAEEGDEDDFEDGGGDGFGVAAPVGEAHVELDEHGSIEAAHNSEYNEWDDFEAVPACRVGDLVQHDFPCTERVQRLEGDSGYHGANKALPHGFVGEIV